MDTSSNGALQLVVYPLFPYKDGKFVPYPSVVEDPSKHFQRIKDFKSRTDDILLCTAQKAGTHLIHEIVSMLIDHTTEYNSRSCGYNVHLDYLPDYNYLESEHRQRIILTHLPFSMLPDRHLQNKSKIVYVNRDPKDRYVSRFNFIKGQNGVPNLTWNDFFEDEVLNDKFNKGWFTYTKEFEEAVDDINIHRVLYEDVVLNPYREIKKLAHFLEVPVDEDFIRTIAEKCSFDQLRNNKFDTTAALHSERKSKIFRKGVIGDWKIWFTVQQNEQFDKKYCKEMKGVDITFTYDYPMK